jgi:hypothetical protein
MDIMLGDLQNLRIVTSTAVTKASDKSMCPGSTQPFEMSTRIFLGEKAAGA